MEEKQVTSIKCNFQTGSYTLWNRLTMAIRSLSYCQQEANKKLVALFDHRGSPLYFLCIGPHYSLHLRFIHCGVRLWLLPPDHRAHTIANFWYKHYACPYGIYTIPYILSTIAFISCTTHFKNIATSS